MMMVTQAPTAGGGSYTLKYIDTDDVERTTAVIYCPLRNHQGRYALLFPLPLGFRRLSLSVQTCVG